MYVYVCVCVVVVGGGERGGRVGNYRGVQGCIYIRVDRGGVGGRVTFSLSFSRLAMFRFIPLFFNTALRSCSHSCHASLISAGGRGVGRGVEERGVRVERGVVERVERGGL